jgi:hypothetical protein
VPALSGRTKNFENWLLVELVDRLWKSGLARDLRTNGHFREKKVKASDVKGLSGSKAKAVHLSADLSLRLRATGRIVSAEIKTGLARTEIFDDLKIVRHYNRREVSDLDTRVGRSRLLTLSRGASNRGRASSPSCQDLLNLHCCSSSLDRDLPSDGPHEGDEFTGDGGDGDVGVLAVGDEPAGALAQPHLRLPGDVLDGLGESLESLLDVGRPLGREPIRPRRLRRALAGRGRCRPS